jgi:hypothetical protein
MRTGSGDQTNFGCLLAHKTFYQYHGQVREGAGNGRDDARTRHGGGALRFWVEMIKRDGTGSFLKAPEKEGPND